MTEKRFTVHIDWYNYEKTEGKATLKDNGQPLICSECVEDVRTLKLLLNEQHEQIGALRRHIERSTFNKIKVEDVFNCAKYDKFYDNEEAIKSIDWIAEQLGVDFE